MTSYLGVAIRIAVRTVVVLLVAVAACRCTDAWAVNSVVIGDVEASPGEVGVTVSLWVYNDLRMSAMVLPLEMRAITPGSFFTNFNYAVQGRVGSSGLMDFATMKYYGLPAANTCSGPSSNTYGTVTPLDYVSPDAFMWIGMYGLNPMLAPGDDPPATPSFLLTFDVTSVEGYFVIDTCCVAPANHILYVDEFSNGAVPLFQSGLVTIGNPSPNTGPVAVCAPLTTEVDPGTCERSTVDPVEVDGGSYDPDDDPITLHLNPLGPYPLGVNNVWLVAEDSFGAFDSCQTTITVLAPAWYSDSDADGFGDPAIWVAQCTAPPGYVADSADNCVSVPNPGQEDGDGDGIGDACDTLRITVYSPVDIIVITPSGQDSIGPGFNTIGSTAAYDSLTDYGLGPNGIPGEFDDRVSIVEAVEGVYVIKVIPEDDADSTDDYFLGVRDPGGNCYGVRDPGGNVVDEVYIAMTGANAPYVCDTPVANPVPEQGECDLVVFAVCAERRGDINNDHVLDVVDVVGVIGVAFRGQPPPAMSFVADVNSDSVTSDVVDVVRIIGHVFRGQPPPGP